jgi:hypothetical protein
MTEGRQGGGAGQAYTKPYALSNQQTADIGPWTDSQNTARPHSRVNSLKLWLRVNKLLGNDI